jgi:septal ring factor EnvC (AmiA/AmiB activator)
MGNKEKTPFIVLNDVEYDIESMTDQQKVMINHLADLDKKLNSMQFNIEQLQVGREAFIKMLSESLTAPIEAIQ